MEPRVETVYSFPVSIFIAGDYDTACETAKSYCDAIGYCVTVTRTKYVHTACEGNGVDGVIIGLINYPRFPAEQEVIMKHAEALAALLLVTLEQESFSIQNPVHTVWYSYRPGDI